ncbi:hypothetical protein K1719_008853 [Acacia pycnantha]|nr:hypothetical protein K1719_008853 [Acacia pycnantha]
MALETQSSEHLDYLEQQLEMHWFESTQICLEYNSSDINDIKHAMAKIEICLLGFTSLNSTIDTIPLALAVTAGGRRKINPYRHGAVTELANLKHVLTLGLSNLSSIIYLADIHERYGPKEQKDKDNDQEVADKLSQNSELTPTLDEEETNEEAEHADNQNEAVGNEQMDRTFKIQSQEKL